jgi:hypothetical protein
MAEKFGLQELKVFIVPVGGLIKDNCPNPAYE